MIRKLLIVFFITQSLFANNILLSPYAVINIGEITSNLNTLYFYSDGIEDIDSFLKLSHEGIEYDIKNIRSDLPEELVIFINKLYHNARRYSGLHRIVVSGLFYPSINNFNVLKISIIQDSIKDNNNWIMLFNNYLGFKNNGLDFLLISRSKKSEFIRYGAGLFNFAILAKEYKLILKYIKKLNGKLSTEVYLLCPKNTYSIEDETILGNLACSA